MSVFVTRLFEDEEATKTLIEFMLFKVFEEEINLGAALTELKNHWHRGVDDYGLKKMHIE